MTELLTAAQMRAIEQAAIGSGEVTGLELMERAGSMQSWSGARNWQRRRTGPWYSAVPATMVATVSLWRGF